jgi:hypothetical protein
MPFVLQFELQIYPARFSARLDGIVGRVIFAERLFILVAAEDGNRADASMRAGVEVHPDNQGGICTAKRRLRDVVAW